jgi:hypothetical protein
VPLLHSNAAAAATASLDDALLVAPLTTAGVVDALLKLGASCAGIIIIIIVVVVIVVGGVNVVVNVVHYCLAADWRGQTPLAAVASGASSSDVAASDESTARASVLCDAAKVPRSQHTLSYWLFCISLTIIRRCWRLVRRRRASTCWAVLRCMLRQRAATSRLSSCC